jgi:hypothetical protein
MVNSNMIRPLVARTGSLLYCRLAVGRALTRHSSSAKIEVYAECHSATRQIGNLRYKGKKCGAFVE